MFSPPDTVVEAIPFDGRGWLVLDDGGDEYFVLDRTVGPGASTYRRDHAHSAGSGTRPVEPRPRTTTRYSAPLAYGDATSAARQAADVRANALLCSFLDAGQLAQWQRGGTFWVATRGGAVRLGEMYKLFHVEFADPCRWRMLCVVTHDHGRIPVGDEWTSMLLALRTTPEVFFSVAVVRQADVWNAARARRAPAAMAADLDLWRQDALHHGRTLDAAYAAMALAKVEGRRRRFGPALALAEGATAVIVSEADRAPDPAVWLRHHEPLLATTADLARRHVASCS